MQAAATLDTGTDEGGEQGAAFQSLGKAHKQPSTPRNTPCHHPISRCLKSLLTQQI